MRARTVARATLRASRGRGSCAERVQVAGARIRPHATTMCRAPAAVCLSAAQDPRPREPPQAARGPKRPEALKRAPGQADNFVAMDPHTEPTPRGVSFALLPAPFAEAIEGAAPFLDRLWLLASFGRTHEANFLVGDASCTDPALRGAFATAGLPGTSPEGEAQAWERWRAAYALNPQLSEVSAHTARWCQND